MTSLADTLDEFTPNDWLFILSAAMQLGNLPSILLNEKTRQKVLAFEPHAKLACRRTPEGLLFEFISPAQASFYTQTVAQPSEIN